jgi:hypothetical protein
MMFNFTPISSLKEYEQYLDWINSMLTLKVSFDSEAGVMLRQAMELVRHYEDVHFAVAEAV